MRNLRIIISTMTLQMKKSFVRPMFRFCLFANPILNTILLYEMYRNAGSDNFMAYVILGAGLSGLWGCICFSSAGDISRERHGGTLSLIFATPASFALIIFGKILGNTLLSMVTLLISLATAEILFHVPLTLAHPGYFLLSLVVLIITFLVISFAIAALLTLSRKTELYMNMIELPFELLCGFVFPLSVLPAGLRYVSCCLPPTHGIQALHMAVLGIESMSDYFRALGYAMGLSGLFLVLALLLYRRIQTRVRVSATLEVA